MVYIFSTSNYIFKKFITHCFLIIYYYKLQIVKGYNGNLENLMTISQFKILSISCNIFSEDMVLNMAVHHNKNNLVPPFDAIAPYYFLVHELYNNRCIV